MSYSKSVILVAGISNFYLLFHQTLRLFYPLLTFVYLYFTRQNVRGALCARLS